MKRKKRAGKKGREGQDSGSKLSLLMRGLYGLSGFCVLALETLWIHEISLWAGNTVIAATLVTVVFFLAAALGNLIGAELVRRKENTLFLYGCFEISAAVVAALTFLAGQWTWFHVTAWPLEQISATVLLVGPPSLLSGLAFPILSEALVSNRALRTIAAGPLYGMNLLGAAVGVISGAVLLPWWLGIQISFALVVALQLAGGVMALIILPRNLDAAPKKEVSPPEKTGKFSAPSTGPMLLALSGLLSLAAQILLIQWARQILQGSVFALAGVLSAFIGGLGVGSFLAAKLRARGRGTVELLAAFAGWNAAMLFAVPVAGYWLIGLGVNLGSHGPLGMLGESLGWSLLALLPLTACLGSIFPLAWELAANDLAKQGTALGRMLAINKTAAALGTGAAVFLLLPHLGLVFSIYIVAWSYLAIAVLTMNRSRRLLWGLAAVAVLAGLALCIESRSWPALGVSPKESLVADYSGFYGPVSVIENKNTGSRQILLNSRQHLSGTRRALASQMHEGWVPLLFSPHPDRVLSIGMAAGITSAAMLDYPVKELDAVELVPEVVRAAHENFGDWNHDLFSDPRVKITIGDGRVVLARLPGKFDVIVCDLFFPCEDSTANVYSRDFFQRARDHLQPDGLFCLWLPCYQLDAETAGIVIHTFQEIFPNAVLVRSNLDPLQPVIGLLGSGQPIPVSRAYLSGRLGSLPPSLQLQSPYFRSPENAQLLLAGDLRACDPDFSKYAITTDDWPLFAFLGPREPRPGERLIGIPFLNWIGKRFMQPSFPSCDLGDTSPGDLLKTIRAANYYFAAAVSDSVLPGDTRTNNERESQVLRTLQHAQSLSPSIQLPDEALGQ